MDTVMHLISVGASQTALLLMLGAGVMWFKNMTDTPQTTTDTELEETQ